ncbi:MAG: IclR family transcriptional regulator [Acidimicrobiia bacterium]
MAQTITAVERTADILAAFVRSDSPTLGVTEIAQELGLSKAVVHRTLNSLKEKGFIEIELASRRYALGPAALNVGLAFLRHVDVRSLARPVMKELSESTRETATLSIRSGWDRIYIDQITPLREVKMTVELGKPFPLHAGSSSKSLLASLPSDDIDEYLSRLDLHRFTDLTITDPDLLRLELAKVRASGFAVSMGERQADAASVAAPVFDHTGRPIASMSLCGPVERFGGQLHEAAPLIVAATRQLAARLGFRPETG